MTDQGRPYLAVDVAPENCCAVIRLDGEVDIASVDHLRAATREVIDMHAVEHLIIDCRQLDFLDSTGVKTLVEAHSAFEGRMALLGPRRPVRRVLEVTGLVSLFSVVDSLDAARQALHQV